MWVAKWRVERWKDQIQSAKDSADWWEGRCNEVRKESDENRSQWLKDRAKLAKAEEELAFVERCRNAPMNKIYVYARESWQFDNVATYRIEDDGVVIYDHAARVVGCVVCYRDDQPEIAVIPID